MNIKNKKTSVIALLVGLFVISANAGIFFDDQPPQSEQEALEKKRFQEEWDRVNAEKKSMLDNLDIDHTAPEVTNLDQKAPDVVIDDNSVIDVDLEAIADRYKRAEMQIQAGERIYVFVSLDMPKTTIKKLVEDSRRVDGALVLRVFYNGSLKETYNKIAELGLSDGNIQINPNAYKKYKVNNVPSFVVVKKTGMYENLDLEGCALPNDYIKISGDVSLKYALEKMVDFTESQENKDIVKKHLGRL